MDEKTYFLNMFSDYEPPETLKNAISQAAIVAADLDPVARTIHMSIHADTYISRKQLDCISADICRLYDLRKFRKMPAKPLFNTHAEVIYIFIQYIN